MWDSYLFFIFLFGLAFFALAIIAMMWAAKQGAFRDFDEQARSIFDETEPEGIQNDFFPGEGPKP